MELNGTIKAKKTLSGTVLRSTGGGGTSDYDALTNRPQINGVTLTGNKTAHDLGLASENALTPEMYGAKGVGTTDDRAAFVSMFAAANDYDTIILQPTTYYISSNITVSKNFLKICAAYHRDEYRPCISTNLTVASNVLFTFTGSGVSIYDVCFKNTSKLATLVYFDADNNTANGDIDGIVSNCVFLNADTGVRARGRNVRVYDCLFSNLNVAVRLNQTTLDTDNRGFEIVNNRIHYCGIGVQNGINNSRANHNIVIANNFADGTAMLFTGYSGGVTIKDNVVDAYGSDNATFIVFDADSSGVLSQIVGNVYRGLNTGTNRGIECRTGTVVDVVGNVIDGCAGLGFVIQGTSRVINNVLTNCGTGAGMYAMAFGSASNAVVFGNTLTGYTNDYSVSTGGVVTFKVNYPATGIPTSASDVGAIAAPSSPTTGDFLVWNGSAWAAKAQTPEVTNSSAGALGTVTLDPEKIYHFTGAITSVTIALASPASGQLAHYHFDFDSGSTAPTVTLPNTVTMPSGFTVEASKHYEIDILNYYGAVMSW